MAEGSSGSSEAQGHELGWWVGTVLVCRAWLTPIPEPCPLASLAKSLLHEELWKMRAGVCPKDRSVPPSVQLTSHFCSIKSTNCCCCCQGPELSVSLVELLSPLRCHSQGEGTARRWRLRTNYYPKGLHLKVKF